MVAAAISIVAWGTFAFGAVYPWAYWPLMGACGTTGAIGIWIGWSQVSRSIAAGLAILVMAVVAQLVPLSPRTISSISPATSGVLARYDLAYAAKLRDLSPTADAARALPSVHSLSIDPQRTLTGLALLVGLGLFLVGLTATLNERLIRQLVGAIMFIGLLIAVLAIVQSPGSNGKVYGFWQPQNRGATPFGPFVNRNHFAGWMLMALPLGLGDFIARLALAMGGVERSWRARLVWLSTPAASGLILAGFALLVMAMSVLLSLSRSGVSCLAATALMFGCFAVRKLARSRRSLVTLYLGVMITICVGWATTDRLAARFEEFRHEGLGTRVGVWRDARHIAHMFPLVGTGLNTFGVATLFYQTANRDEHYAEAHSDYLQIAAEGGLLLTIPAVLLIALIAREAQRRFSERRDQQGSYWVRAGAVSGLLAIALQEMGEFSLQMPGSAVFCSMLLAIAVYESGDAPARRMLAVRR